MFMCKKHSFNYVLMKNVINNTFFKRSEGHNNMLIYVAKLFFTYFKKGGSYQFVGLLFFKFAAGYL